MRLLYLANIRMPSEKAHVYQIMQMCEAFAETGVQVTLLHADRRNAPELQGVEDVWAHYDVARNFEREKIPCVDWFSVTSKLRGRVRRVALRMVSLLQIISYTLALIMRVRPGDADIFYSRDSVTLAALLALRPKLRGQTSYEAHDFAMTRLGVWLRGWLVRWVAGMAVTTKSTGKLFNEKLGVPLERLKVAPNGVRLERFVDLPDCAECRDAVGLPADEFIVGYVGRLYLMGMSKGTDTLIDAFAMVVNENAIERSRLCVVGGPDEAVDALREQLFAQGLTSELIIAPGQVSPRDVPCWMRAFDVCVLPTPQSVYFANYVLPLKLLEYMASGTPIVATDLPAIQGIVRGGENAVLIPPDDPEAMAKALRGLRDDPAMGERLAMQARRDVEQYTWRSRADGILAFVEKRIAGG